MVEVVIADDHSLIREGLKKMISTASNEIEVIHEASNANELMEILNRQLPDIVLLDITMPGKSGLEALKEIRNLYPNLPVLILSMHPEERFAFRALKAGAAGYFFKRSIYDDELIRAIRMIVTQKRRYISPEVADQLAQHIDNSKTDQLHDNLSDREYQVLRMIASGKKVSTIARELSLSVQTIHTYRSRLKDKMKMTTDTELTKYAIQHELVD